MKKSMKTKKLLLMAVMALIAMTARAQTWNCGYPNEADMTATLSDGILTFDGKGNMRDYSYNSYPPWTDGLIFTTKVTEVNFTGIVTSIGNNAFLNCKSITSVTLPKTLTFIGDFAFSSCTNLTHFDLEDGSAAYSVSDGIIYDKNKTTIVCYPQGQTNYLFSIPSTVTKVSSYAFTYSQRLSSVFISANVDTIGYSAFYKSNIKSIILSSNVKYIDMLAFSECVYLSDITVFWNNPSDVTLNNGRPGYDDVFFLVNKNTDIPELQQQAGITVSPSPAVDFVTISGLQGNETLNFYNINGQLLITRKADGEMENVPVGNWPSGVYFVKISNGQILKWVKR